MELHNHYSALSSEEKNALLSEYNRWLQIPRQNKVDPDSFFPPVNMGEQELVAGLRNIHNSSLKFIPIFLIWYIAQLACTLGKISSNLKLETWGRSTLKILQNFRVLE